MMRGCLFLLCLVALSGCQIKSLTPKAVETYLTRLAPDQYGYADEDFAVAFKVGPGHHVAWEFRNKYALDLALDYRTVYVRDGKGDSFNLWGDPLVGTPVSSMMQIKGGTFISLSYPVRYNSCFVPWTNEKRRGFILVVDAQWKNFSRQYRLYLPPEE